MPAIHVCILCTVSVVGFALQSCLMAPSMLLVVNALYY